MIQKIINAENQIIALMEKTHDEYSRIWKDIEEGVCNSAGESLANFQEGYQTGLKTALEIIQYELKAGRKDNGL